MAIETNRRAGRRRPLIVLFDERRLTCQALALWIGKSAAGYQILPVLSFEELDAALEQGKAPELVLLSIGGVEAGAPAVLDLLDELDERLPDVPTILLADREDPEGIVAAFRRGVRGYIPTSVDSLVAVIAVRLVEAGGTFVPAGSVLDALQQASDEHGAPGVAVPDPKPAFSLVPGAKAPLPLDEWARHFTPRQMDVLRLIQEGKSNKIIAYELSMTESTVKVHVRQIMRKLHATNRTQVALLASQSRAAEHFPAA